MDGSLKLGSYMNVELKKKIIEYMYDAYEQSLLDKHSMHDFVMYGSTFPGLANMSDTELIDDYESMVDDDNELLLEVKADIAISKMLTE
jgi:hypothetical protein